MPRAVLVTFRKMVNGHFPCATVWNGTGGTTQIHQLPFQAVQKCD